jgi:hypothetical protein
MTSSRIQQTERYTRIPWHISLLEEDECHCIFQPDNALCHYSNEIMPLLAFFLVIFLLPRPLEVTTLHFYFIHTLQGLKLILEMKFER